MILQTLVQLTILAKEVAFHNAYIRASDALLGSLLKSAFKPAGKGDSSDKGRTRRTRRKATSEIQ